MDQRAPHGIIGRDEELAAVRGFLSALASGPAALVIHGEPGIGKTTLWRAGLDTAREQSIRVLSAAPAEAEMRLSFAALGDLLEDVRDCFHLFEADSPEAVDEATRLAGFVGARVTRAVEADSTA